MSTEPSNLAQEFKLSTLLKLVGAAVFLVMAHAYLTDQMTELLLKAQRKVENRGELKSKEKDVPADLEVRSAAEVEQINSGQYPSFDSRD